MLTYMAYMTHSGDEADASVEDDAGEDSKSSQKHDDNGR